MSGPGHPRASPELAAAVRIELAPRRPSTRAGRTGPGTTRAARVSRRRTARRRLGGGSARRASGVVESRRNCPCSEAKCAQTATFRRRIIEESATPDRVIEGFTSNFRLRTSTLIRSTQARCQPTPRRAQMRVRVVPERDDERMALEEGLHDAALDAATAPVNQPDFRQTCFLCGV